MADQNNNKSILDQLGESFIRSMDNEIQPGDENTKANNLQNYLIDKLGLPSDWQSTVAEDKNYYKNLPELMGMNSAGRIGSIENGLQQIANQPLPQAIAEKVIGPTSTAEAIAASKALGNTVHVVPDATERFANIAEKAGKPRFGKIIQK